MWNTLESTLGSDLKFGGKKTPIPEALSEFLELSDEAQKCNYAVDTQAAPHPLGHEAPTSPECPAFPPDVGDNCTIAEQDLSCSYGEFCCPIGGECYNTTFASCDSSLEWRVSQAIIQCPEARLQCQSLYLH
jgi:hypothetical protein